MNFYEDLEKYGQLQALIAAEGESLTYASVAAAADSFASHFAGRQLVLILADNCMASVIGYLGCLRSRTPVALLAANIHPDLLSKLLSAYRPNYVWMPQARACELPDAENVYTFEGYVLIANSRDPLEAHDDLALLMSTSGSTGSAKFVRLSYQNIASNAATIAEFLELREDDKAITTLPMHYVYGLSVINSHLQVGASVVLATASLMEKRFWSQMKTHRVTSIAGVPYTYEVLKRLRWERMELPDVRVITQAGGKLNAALVKEFAGDCRDKGIRFYVMYGAAEATARMAYLPPSQALEKPASIGGPIPGGEFWITDADGNVVDQADAVGELIYRGPNVSLGYAVSRDDLNRGDERGQILQTGDLAKRDQDGLYYIVGRKSRFIKLFGNRVNLEEVEQLIREAGIDCACAGDDQRLCIYITTPTQQSDAVSVAQRMTQLHKSAFRAIVIDRIPRNEAGKILYAELPSDL